MNKRELKPHFGSEISLKQDTQRPRYESSMMKFETQKLLDLEIEKLKGRHPGTVQVDQSDLNQVGDLEIIVWNKHKTKQLISFKCRQNSLNLNKCQLEKRKSAHGSEHLRNLEKTISKISLEILEDSQGKPNYRFSLDTLGTSLISQVASEGVKKLHWKGGKGAFDLEMSIDSKKPKQRVLPPSFKKVIRVQSEIIRNRNQNHRFQSEIEKCSFQQRLKGKLGRVLEFFIFLWISFCRQIYLRFMKMFEHWIPLFI